MANVRVFGFEVISNPRALGPGQFVVAAPARKSVVPNAANNVGAVDNACANLLVWVFTPLSAKKCNCHEIVVPREVAAEIMVLKERRIVSSERAGEGGESNDPLYCEVFSSSQEGCSTTCDPTLCEVCDHRDRQGLAADGRSVEGGSGWHQCRTLVNCCTQQMQSALQGTQNSSRLLDISYTI